MTEKHRSLFEDLGKPTLRGVRKCPKCGTYNGTRGMSCKNKACKLIFKIIKDKNKADPEADSVKVINISNLQIYSVRNQDINDDRRCFVHLPVIEGIEALQDASEITVIKQSAAMCYAPTCRKPMEDMCTITLNLNPCSHTQLVVNCSVEAEPLPLKNVVLKVMPISDDIKNEILDLAKRSSDPLVQRVTKNCMVVKCNPDDKHPLGFLHFSVFEPVKSSKKYRILCDCQNELTKPFVPREKQMCLHFYMCVCAFASNTKFLNEFRPLIQSVPSLKSSSATDITIMKCEADSVICETNSELRSLKDVFSEDMSSPPKRKKNESPNINTLYLLQENNAAKPGKSQKKVCTDVNKKQGSNETAVMLTFEQWLGSVTERINQTMHYQFNGNPESLTFHVPQAFFDILQQRISAGSKKKRLPNAVVAFSRKDSLPIGVFSKYTWHITNILHVKRIFDTPDMPLEVTRSFIENKDGTYIPYDPVQHEREDLAENFRKTLNNLLIKPLELKTFLKVGNMTLNQKEPTPFIVEWIPDILPKTHVGELRIKFEYGHQRNGVIENRNGLQSTSSENQNT